MTCFSTTLKALCFLAAIGTCLAQSSIVEIQAKTVDADDAGMDAGSVNVEILNTDFDACVISGLDSEENDFQRDEVNVFWDSMIQDCLGFFLPDNQVPLLTLTHDGGDAWQPEWIRVMLNDSTFLMCYDGQVLDDTEFHELECQTLDTRDQTVLEIQAKTVDADEAGMNGQINVEIINIDFDACVISDLGSDENDFERNRVDVFWDSDLQACYAFPIPDSEIPRLTLTHSGSDAWQPEWIRVLLADSTYLMCYDGEVIDDAESHELECVPYSS